MISKRFFFIVAAMILTISGYGQMENPPYDAGGAKAPTVALERGRKVYVESSCHFCHGVDLKQAQMGAANLLDSQLVGADVGGNLIGAITKAGLPNLQTSMPRYDFTIEEIKELADYVHYLRQEGRFARLINSPLLSGDVTAGREYVRANRCEGCHQPTDLARFSLQPLQALRRNYLLPKESRVEEGKRLSQGAIAHRKLLESETIEDESNALAYLRSLGSSSQ